MEDLIHYVAERNPSYAKEIEKKVDKYVAFLKHPEEVRGKIYTTNVVESINAGLEYMRMEHGGYFASMEMLSANLFIKYSNLHDRWLSRPDSKLLPHLYKIRKLFALRIELDEDIQVISLKNRERPNMIKISQNIEKNL